GETKPVMGNGQLGLHFVLAFVGAPGYFVVVQGEFNRCPQFCSFDRLQKVSLRVGFAGPFDSRDIIVGGQVDDWYVEALLKKLGGFKTIQRSLNVHQHDVWTQLRCSGNGLLSRGSDVEWPVAAGRQRLPDVLNDDAFVLDDEDRW